MTDPQPLPESIRFTLYIDRGYRAIRLEGRLALDAIFGGEVAMNLASPTGVVPEWTLSVPGEVPAASGRGKAA